jgi:hypothetical protein
MKMNSASIKGIKGTNNVSAAGIERLCRSICPELIAYKRILEQADNLRADEVEETYQELDQRVDCRWMRRVELIFSIEGSRKKTK